MRAEPSAASVALASDMLYRAACGGISTASLRPKGKTQVDLCLHMPNRDFVFHANFPEDAYPHHVYRKEQFRHLIPVEYSQEARLRSLSRVIDKFTRLAVAEQSIREVREEVFQFASTKMKTKPWWEVKRPHTYSRMTVDDCLFWMAYFALMPSAFPLLAYSGQASKSLQPGI